MSWHINWTAKGESIVYMYPEQLILEQKEFVFVKRLLGFHQYYEDYIHKDALDRLRLRIEKALVLEEHQLPADVVRLYSKLTLMNDHGQIYTITLVPSEKEDGVQALPVLSPLGSQLLGRLEGATVTFGHPSRIQHLRIERVQTPKDKRLELL